jgi:deoxyribonuclease V
MPPGLWDNKTMGDGLVLIRCYEELNDLLPAETAKKDFLHPVKRGMKLGELLGELGVPASEVDLALVDGKSVDLCHALQGGERVSLYPVFESLNIQGITQIRAVPLAAARLKERFVVASLNITAAAAVEVQQQLRHKVVTSDDLGEVRLVAGIDVGYDLRGRVALAAAAVLSFPDLQLVEQATARCVIEFPYIPGLLSFREMPAVLQALGRLQRIPDLLLCDGHGYAHPRRFGLACHVGVVTGIPSIGAAKTRLIGTFGDLQPGRGSWTPLWDGDEAIGAVVRTRAGVKPVFVSIGHRISLEGAVEYVLRCTARYRLPETTRWAHKLASDRLHKRPDD